MPAELLGSGTTVTYRKMGSEIVNRYLDALQRGVANEVRASNERLTVHLDELVRAISERLDGISERLDGIRDRQTELQTAVGLVDQRLVKAAQRDRYDALRRISASVEDIRDLTAYEAKVFSQNGEDGIIAEIFRRIGATNRFFVEIGVESLEGNCLVLADLFGWSGLFIDGNAASVEAVRKRYRGRPGVHATAALVTAENIERLLEEASVPQDVDLISIDVDGNDYWLWKALNRWKPRVVIIEYNSAVAEPRAAVQPYDANFVWDGVTLGGASLGALRELAARKGYRFVYAEAAGVNVFFVREEYGEYFLPEEEVYRRATDFFLNAEWHDAERPPHWPTCSAGLSSSGGLVVLSFIEPVVDRGGRPWARPLSELLLRVASGPGIRRAFAVGGVLADDCSRRCRTSLRQSRACRRQVEPASLRSAAAIKASLAGVVAAQGVP